MSPDQILLTDANQRKIYVFNDRGEVLTKTGLEKIQYKFPTGFHYDGNNKLYLLDGSRILVFTAIMYLQKPQTGQYDSNKENDDKRSNIRSFLQLVQLFCINFS